MVPGKGEFFDTEKEWPSQSKKTAFLEMSHLEESKKSRHLKVGQNDWSSDYVWELNDWHKVSKGQQNSCNCGDLIPSASLEHYPRITQDS